MIKNRPFINFIINIIMLLLLIILFVAKLTNKLINDVSNKFVVGILIIGIPITLYLFIILCCRRLYYPQVMTNNKRYHDAQFSQVGN